MLIISHWRVCGSSELFKWHFKTVLIYAIVFVIGVVDVFMVKERGLTYATTVTGTMDIDRLFRQTQSGKWRHSPHIQSPGTMDIDRLLRHTQSGKWRHSPTSKAGTTSLPIRPRRLIATKKAMREVRGSRRQDH